MNLLQTIKRIENVASHQPSVNMIVENDVYRLNECPDAKYGVFAWLQGQHTTSIESGTINFQFTFFYVDRLKADISNQIEIQSVGIQTLDNIIKTLETYGIWATDYNFQAFNKRFIDECAGVYCNVTFNVPSDSLCNEQFADFNNDFNEDFLIF